MAACSGWDGVLPFFKSCGDQERGAEAHHGTGGPVAVFDIRTEHALGEAFHAASEALDVLRNPDFKGAAFPARDSSRSRIAGNPSGSARGRRTAHRRMPAALPTPRSRKNPCGRTAAHGSAGSARRIAPVPGAGIEIGMLEPMLADQLLPWQDNALLRHLAQPWHIGGDHIAFRGSRLGIGQNIAVQLIKRQGDDFQISTGETPQVAGEIASAL